MKLGKLTQRGHAHLLLPFIVILIVGAIGTYLLNFSHAATPNEATITGVAGKCLDNWHNQKVDYNKIDLYACNKTSAQDWDLNKNGTITNSDGYCLDVYHSGVKSGTKVDLFNCNGTAAQQWTVNTSAKTIVNPHSNLCLDDQFSISKNGNQIWAYNCNGTAAQQWTVNGSAYGVGTGPVITGGGNGTAGGSIPKTSGTNCYAATGPFTTHGSEVLQANGTPFISYGITLSTFQYYPGTYLDNKNESTLSQVEAQLRAMTTGWCANTVRLQIEQGVLVGADGKTNAAYMSAVESAVTYATKTLGLVVVLNAQTEPNGSSVPKDIEPLPTTNTELFWHDMDAVYAHNPQVVYDIFNEPRANELYPAKPQPSETTLWNDWLNGVTIGGKTFIGEQTLANYIRSDGSKNLFWVEGTTSNELDYLVQDPGTYVLKGDGPIVYSYHHPTTGGVPRTPANWNAQFADLVTKDIAPVVDGEWTTYTMNSGWTSQTSKATATHAATIGGDSGACWKDASTAVPEYLQYLQNLGVGMSAWTLGWNKDGTGYLNSTPGDYITPTQIKSNWSCTNNLDQGAGQLVQKWFYQQNS